MPAPPGGGYPAIMPVVNNNGILPNNAVRMNQSPSTATNTPGNPATYAYVASAVNPGTFTFFTEENDPPSPMEALITGGSTIKRSLWTASATRWQAAVDMIGYPLYVPTQYSSSGGVIQPSYINRNLPVQYFGFCGAGGQVPITEQGLLDASGGQVLQGEIGQPGWISYYNNIYPFFYCSSCSSIEHVQPNNTPLSIMLLATGGASEKFPGASLAGSSDVNTYTFSRMEFAFTRRRYTILPDSAVYGTGSWTNVPDESCLLRYVTRIPRTAGRFFVTPKGFAWFVPAPGGNDGAPQVIPEGINLNQPDMEFTIIWHEIPIVAIPWAAIQSTQGCVNNFTFDPYFINAPAETCLFEGMDYDVVEHPVAGFVATVRYRFKLRYNVDLSRTARGWNYSLRSFTNVLGMPILDYREVALYDPTGINKGASPYKDVDFSNLFRPAVTPQGP